MIDHLNGQHQQEPAAGAPYEGLLTVKEAAAYVGLSPQGVEYNVRRGTLERTKIDGTFRYRKEDLDLFNARRVSSTATPLVDTPPP